MTEYHKKKKKKKITELMSWQRIYSNTVVYGENEYMVNLVTCLFLLFWST